MDLMAAIIQVYEGHPDVMDCRICDKQNINESLQEKHSIFGTCLDNKCLVTNAHNGYPIDMRIQVLI